MSDKTVQPAEPEVLTVLEAAQLLRVGKNVVYELVSQNKIPHQRIGRKQIRFSRQALMSWLTGCSSQVAPMKGGH